MGGYSPYVTVPYHEDIDSPSEQGSAKAVELRCEYMPDPLGVDVTKPRLSWAISDARPGARQHAYRIRVASSNELLRVGTPDLWDTGKRLSDQTTHVVYDGGALRSRQHCFWQVEIWDRDDVRGEMSDVARWEMGLLEESAWTAKWIASPDIEPLEDYRARAKWLYASGGDPGAASRVCWFRRKFVMRGRPLNAVILLTARGREVAIVPALSVFINGELVEEIRCSAYYEQVAITEYVCEGDCEVVVSVPRSEPVKDVLVAALIRAEVAGGERLRIVTDREWEQYETEGMASLREAAASAWHPAKEAGARETEMFGPPAPHPRPVYFRKQFEVKTIPKLARLYVGSCGTFKLYLNGSVLPGNALSPEWTDYSKRLPYQVWDITPRLAAGPNALAVLLAAGWYGGALGWQRRPYNYGDPPLRLLVQMEIVESDGTTKTVTSDGSWAAGYGPLLMSDLYDGEVWDARFASPGWDRTEFDDRGWPRARVVAGVAPLLVAQRTHPVEVVEELEPTLVSERGGGHLLVDFGQNTCGRVYISLCVEQPSEVVVRYGELLDANNELDQSNLQSARCTDTFVIEAGGGTQVCGPVFAYRGFRYADIRVSPPGALIEKIVATVLQSATPATSELECANEMISLLYEAIVRTQRSNTLSVLTDCPQRDERLGWSGDAQIFWRTACYNAEMAPLAAKWLKDFVDAQTPDGIFPVVVPPLRSSLPGAPGYADAPIRLAWTTYTHYGDLQIIEENWNAMQKWMSYIHSCNPHMLWTNCRDGDLGDWLALDEGAPKEVCATAHWAYNARLMAAMARALGKAELRRYYGALQANIAQAFERKYISADGKVANGSQSAYVFALFCNLVPPDLVPAVFGRFLDCLKQYDWHMTTGIFTSQMVLPVLSSYGRDDIAYRLLLEDSFPSWGYMLRCGATTIWERWDSDRAGPQMNSRNHVALGAVGEWLYKYAGGIDFDPDRPGFKHVLFRPHFCPHVKSFAVSHRTMYGWVKSSWRASPSREVIFHFELPPNTTGAAYLPADGELWAGDEGLAHRSGRVERHVRPLEAGTAEFAVKLTI
jgi:alpha-L-rhamnosidase